ncbi:hypothetical protein BGZ93_009027 [Podila epicladia]|nr:hypothetical protein BGZ92_006897 [Podila epicladia]KAG0099143.1 hypothetical protein BGZ93_009027 [Podila epicladia]
MFSSHLTRATRGAVVLQRTFSHSSLAQKSFPALVREIDATNKDIHHITPKELHSSLAASSTPHVVDVRERSEIDRTGTIPGAIPLPRGILERDIGKFIPQDDSRDVVVYCAGGFRSILAAESLTRLGYGTGESEAKNKVYSLDEGMEGWIKSGFSVEKK